MIQHNIPPTMFECRSFENANCNDYWIQFKIQNLKFLSTIQRYRIDNDIIWRPTKNLWNFWKVKTKRKKRGEEYDEAYDNPHHLVMSFSTLLSPKPLRPEFHASFFFPPLILFSPLFLYFLSLVPPSQFHPFVLNFDNIFTCPWVQHQLRNKYIVTVIKLQNV